MPYLTSMVNASLVQGHLPVSQKHAIVSRLLKKPELDSSNLANSACVAVAVLGLCWGRGAQVHPNLAQAPRFLIGSIVISLSLLLPPKW